MFEIAPPAPKPIFEQADEWQPYLIDDFTGGLNTSDPSNALRKNQFTAMLNYYLQPNRTLKVRGPFRPWLVASEDTILPDSAPPLTFIIVELRGNDFRVACWDSGAATEVSVYDEVNDRWAGETGGTSINAALTDGYPVRFAKFSVNDAEDLLYCNGKDTPQRWVGTVDTAGSDLGLEVPVDGGVSKIFADPDNSLGGGVIAAATHASADGGASTILTFASAVTDVIVGEHISFAGVAAGGAATWNVAGGVACTAVSGATMTFAVTYNAGADFTAADITHEHWTLTAAATGSANERGITINGTYYYRFTYFHDDSGTSTKYGESGPNSVNSSIAVAASSAAPYEVSITTLHLPSTVTHINIYRSPPNQSIGPFEYVGKIEAENVAFIDNIPNGEEGVEMPIDAGTPPKLKNPVSHDGRIWGIGINAVGALTNKGVWCQKASPDFFATSDFIYFPDALAGPALFNKLIYWFTEKQIWVTTNLADPKNSTVKICDIGCDSWDSIVDVGNGLVWQYDGNIYWANFNSFNPTTGDLPWPIGDPINNKIINIPVAQRADSNGVFHKDRYYLSFAGPNQTVPTATLVWDIKDGTRQLQQGITGAWSSLSWAANFMQSFNGTLYTADNTNKYIMEHDFAGTADFTSKTNYDASTSNDIATELATGDVHFGDEWAEKLVNSLSLMTKTSGITLNATVSFNGNEFRRTKAFTLGSGSLAVDSTWLIWGQGTWGNFNWGSTSYGLEGDHKKIGKGGKGRDARLTLESSDSEDTNLILAKLYYKRLPTVA